MFKVKSIFNKDIAYKEKSDKIGKTSLVKKVIVGVMLTVAGIAACDVAILSGDVAKVNTIANYKVNHYKSLSSYSTFKSQIDAVPYTDAQFNYDLKTLDYLYGHKDNVMYRKIMNARDDSYGSKINLMIVNGFKYKNQNENYERLLQATKGLPDSEVKDLPTGIFRTMETTVDFKENPNMSRKFMSSTLRLSNIYGGLGPMSSGNKNIYSNMNSYLKEKGYGENILFIDSNFAYNRSKLISTTEGINKYYHDTKLSANKANLEIEKYYKSGDKEKLRKLLQMARAFSYVMVEKPMDYVNKNSLETNLISSVLYNGTYDGSLILDSARFIAKEKGEYTPENAVYYDDPFALYY